MTDSRSKHDVLVRDYFDQRVAQYDAFYDPPSPFLRAFNHIFRKPVYLRRDQAVAVALQHHCKTMLDVGCGSAQNSVYFVRHGLEHVYGIDVSIEMISLAQQLADRAGVTRQCEFKHADFMSLQPDPKYDAVVACGVFDYVLNAEEFLGHMAKFARRVIYGSFPGWTLVRTPLRKLRYALRGCPTHFYRRNEIIRIFERVGYGRIEIMPAYGGHLAWAIRDHAD